MILTMPPPRPRGLGYGWGISLAVHALLVAWLLHLPVPRPDAGPAPKRIDFVLLAPQRQATPPVETQPAAPALPGTPATRSPRRSSNAAQPATARPHAAPAAIEADVPASDPAPPATTETPPVEAAPAFDMAAARSTARAAAHDGNPSLVVRPKLPPTLDPAGEIRREQLSRDLERARRSDCKSAYSGLGLFAVIPLVKDAVTGTGCRW